MRPPRRLIVPPELGVITTPLVASVWEAELRGHPDSEFADFLVEGIQCGFRIGFDYGSQVGISATNNMHSAREHPEPIDRYVREEMSAGRIIRLSSGSAGEGVTAQGIHVSRFGVIPKSHQPGKWRLISDLSSPKGSSVNDGVSPSLCSVSYAAVDDAVRCILALGQGALLAKFDVASAYRVVPVHPEDRLLLGMKWRGELLVDGASASGRHQNYSQRWLTHFCGSWGDMALSMLCTTWTIICYWAHPGPWFVTGLSGLVLTCAKLWASPLRSTSWKVRHPVFHSWAFKLTQSRGPWPCLKKSWTV